MKHYSAQVSNFGVWVSAIIHKSGELLVIKRERNGVLKYSLPGGNVGIDEICDEALERELKEEIGGDVHRKILCDQQDMLVTRACDGLLCRKLHLIYHVTLSERSTLKSAEVDDVQGRGDVMFCDITQLQAHTLYPLINRS